jgi:hypothetical protein
MCEVIRSSLSGLTTFTDEDTGKAGQNSKKQMLRG